MDLMKTCPRMTDECRVMSRNVALFSSQNGWHSVDVRLERGWWQSGKEGGWFSRAIGYYTVLLAGLWWY